MLTPGQPIVERGKTFEMVDSVQILGRGDRRCQCLQWWVEVFVGLEPQTKWGEQELQASRSPRTQENVWLGGRKAGRGLCSSERT